MSIGLCRWNKTIFGFCCNFPLKLISENVLVVQSNVNYHCTVPTDSMGRKFRLTRKKRYYCVTVPSLTVSIPLDVIHVCPVPSPRQSSLCISWSRELFESSPVDSVHSLHSRISRAEVIPVGKTSKILMNINFTEPCVTFRMGLYTKVRQICLLQFCQREYYTHG